MGRPCGILGIHGRSPEYGVHRVLTDTPYATYPATEYIKSFDTTPLHLRGRNDKCAEGKISNLCMMTIEAGSRLLTSTSKSCKTWPGRMPQAECPYAFSSHEPVLFSIGTGYIDVHYTRHCLPTKLRNPS